MKCSIKKFSEMYEIVYRDLYRYALCLMKNPQEAEDAVSEAVIAAYENIHKLKKEEAFKNTGKRRRTSGTSDSTGL